ncbi:MAG: tetratricopeptide repeat protein [Gammaproteobacteria bacterium]
MMRSKAAMHTTRAAALAVAVFTASFAVDADAREPLYGALEYADLLNCENIYWHGVRSEATTCYRGLLGAAQPAVRAEALWALNDIQGANSAFQEAVDAEPQNPMHRVRWGELYLRTYQFGEAYNLFNEALEIEPDNAWANLGAALALSQSADQEMVNAHLEKVVENALAPKGAQLRGLIFMLHNALEQDRFDDARGILAEAKEVADEGDLPQMTLKAHEAALQFMTFQPYQEFIDAALEESPGYGDAWAIPGYFAMATRRYHESGEFYEQAVTVQPDHWEAHLELGQNYLRLNQVTPAVDHVRASYEGDAFNPKTVNMLRLLDTFLDKMEVLSYPNPPEGPFPTLQLRLDRSEIPVLETYARRLAEDSIALYSERYRFTPKEPIIVEIYPNHEDFVVRSIGMPGVGLLGVTFGYLFAMDSPTAHPAGESYHWGTTLWHEMAHVFTVEASQHLVPRWFSEGVSVFEEWRTGPIPGRKIPGNVLQAMSEDKFISVADLDDGFMRPTYSDQVIVSYMQAGLVFDFIDRKFGFDKIVDMLYLFPQQVSARDAIERTLGITIEDFDAQFDEFIEAEYGPLLRQMPAWQENHRASFEALEQENWQAAVDAATRANTIYPDYVEADSPYIALARAYSRLEDEENEFRTLEAFWQRGGFAPRALLALADRYEERGMLTEAMEVLEDVKWADPFAEELHVELGDLYMTMDQPQQALTEYEILLALDPVDKADANLKLARAHNALGNEDETMEYLLTALDIAPQYREAQAFLLELSRGAGAAGEATAPEQTETEN